MRRPSGTGWSCPTRPTPWGWGAKAHLLVGALAHSGRVARAAGRVRGPAAPDRRPGPRSARAGWADPGLAVRPDGHRLPPGHRPGHRLVRRGREALRGVGGDLPARRGNRKGVVEKANHTAAQRWWRTLADDVTRRGRPRPRWTGSAPLRGDTRLRPHRPTARPPSRAVAEAEPLAAVPPAPFPAVLDRRSARSSRAGAGRLPRQPLLGAARAGPRPRSPSRHRLGAAIHRHRHRPAGS